MLNKKKTINLLKKSWFYIIILLLYIFMFNLTKYSLIKRMAFYKLFNMDIDLYLKMKFLNLIHLMVIIFGLSLFFCNKTKYKKDILLGCILVEGIISAVFLYFTYNVSQMVNLLVFTNGIIYICIYYNRRKDVF